jgi:ubiquitin-like 1-activating enzyme E1 B
LKKEAEELKEMKSLLGHNNFAEAVFKKVQGCIIQIMNNIPLLTLFIRHYSQIFKKDVERLIAMEDMWTARKPPVALDYDALLKESNGKLPVEGVTRDQNVWTLAENFSVFLSR